MVETQKRAVATETFGEGSGSLAIFPASVSLPLKRSRRDQGARLFAGARGMSLVVAWLGMTVGAPADTDCPDHAAAQVRPARQPGSGLLYYAKGEYASADNK